MIVTVLNVNVGHNAELMQHCNTLNEYAQYVARVRHYAADMSLDQAVERAVDECQGRDFSRISYPQPKRGHQYEYF